MRKKQSDKLPVAWTKGIPAEKKKDFEDAVRNSTTALGKLQELLDDKIDDCFDKSLAEPEYTNPAWPYKQAYENGYAAGIRYVVDLLSFLPRDK